MWSRFSGVGASAWMRASKVLFVSSIMTVIEPGTSMPAARKSAGLTRWASVVISARPRLWERRRAGSMVRQRTRLPRRAAARPRAAVVVVLPTPRDSTGLGRLLDTRRVIHGVGCGGGGKPATTAALGRRAARRPGGYAAGTPTRAPR